MVRVVERGLTETVGSGTRGWQEELEAAWRRREGEAEGEGGTERERERSYARGTGERGVARGRMLILKVIFLGPSAA